MDLCEDVKQRLGKPCFAFSGMHEWYTAAWVDYLNLRLNGPDVHRQLVSGNLSYTDARIEAVFSELISLFDRGYFNDDHANRDWSSAAGLMLEGDAPMMLIGAWFQKNLQNGLWELTEHWSEVYADIDFFRFPVWTQGLPLAEDMPTDALILSTTEALSEGEEPTQNSEGAKDLLQFIMSDEYMHRIVHLIDIPTRSSLRQWKFDQATNKTVAEGGDHLISKVYQFLDETDVTFQFFDRDTNRVMTSLAFDVFRLLLDSRPGADLSSSDLLRQMLEDLDAARLEAYQQQVSQPYVEPPSGTYEGSIKVNATVVLDGSEVLYSDHEDTWPEAGSPIFPSSGLELPVGEHTLRFIATKDGLKQSTVVSRNFILVDPNGGASLQEDYLEIVIVSICAAVGVVVLAVCTFTVWRIIVAFRQKRRMELEQVQRDEELVKNACCGLRTLSQPMACVPAGLFLTLGRLVTCECLRDAGYLIFLDSWSDAILAKRSKTIIFFSHQWLDWGRPDPSNKQYDAMVSAVTSTVDKLKSAGKGANLSDVWIWVDYMCVAQRNREAQKLAISSLQAYASLSDYFIIIAPTANHCSTGGVCDLASYLSRGWCRVEVLSKVCSTGFSNIFVAAGNDGSLRELCQDSFEEMLGSDVLRAFSGVFSCCSRAHADGRRCDKETLTQAGLGLLALSLTEDEKANDSSPLTPRQQRTCATILALADELFPKEFIYCYVTSKGVEVSERRTLFGSSVAVLKSMHSAGLLKDGALFSVSDHVSYESHEEEPLDAMPARTLDAAVESTFPDKTSWGVDDMVTEEYVTSL